MKCLGQVCPKTLRESPDQHGRGFLHSVFRDERAGTTSKHSSTATTHASRNTRQEATMEWLIPFFVGVATIPASALILIFVRWAVSRDYGYGPCRFCPHFGGEDGRAIGDRTNLSMWFAGRKHNLIARMPWHKRIAGDHYRNMTEKGWITFEWDSRFMM